MTEYTPGEPDTWTWPDAYGDDDVSIPTVCAVCRNRPVPPDRSVCDTCFPVRSQVAAVGAAPPKTWDDYEAGCLATFGGGYRSDSEASAFRHGMQTVFNLLRAEFPPAESCRAALHANEQIRALLARLVGNQDTRCSLDHHGYCQEHNFAAPCPVPEAQKLTGTGTEYVPTVGR